MFDRPRTSWEQAGMTVGEHTDARPINWGRVDSIVIHYTAAETADTDTARWLAQMQRSYVNGRGYSLGYSCAVDQDGVCWEIRGADYIPAATKNENGHTFAVLQLVDWQNPANPAMVERTRQLVAALRQQNRMSITGHRDWAATRCPGDGIYGQIEAGAFEPQPPTPPAPRPEYDVKIIDPPQRLYDSRNGQPLAAGETRPIATGQTGAVFVNITAVDPTGSGWIAAWGAGQMPNTSVLNYQQGQTICNSAWVPVAPGGTLLLHSSAGTHILVDLQAGV